jgi:glycosyltransferase involved in cell wall biosynthesis
VSPQPRSAKWILFVLGSDYLPAISGANVSLHALCRRLVAAGYDPIVACASGATLATPAAPYGYPVLRLEDPVAATAEIVARLEPRAVVVYGPTQERVARLPTSTGRSVHVYFQSDFLRHRLASRDEAPGLRYAANSPFLARLLECCVGPPVAVVPPLIEPSDYRCEHGGDAILFINPVAIKGARLVAAIAARLRHRRFLFVRSWPDHPDFPHVDVRLDNVEWTASTSDMRQIYARARVVLMPSVVEETFGRIVAEAAISGIPAVTSDRGGLRESVGEGGVVLSLADPIERWCEAIERVFQDPAHYAALSEAAEARAARPDRQPEAAVARFLDFIAS